MAEIAQALLHPLSDAGQAALKAFAGFAHAARTIAGETRLPVEKRIAMLDALEALLEGRKPEVPLALPVSAAARETAEALRAAGLDMTPAKHLLQAWRQDCAKPGFRDWADWMLFARFAAAPFGRLWIDAAREQKAALPAAEALACALLFCLHLQNAVEDAGARGKVYLPERWLREHGVAAEDLSEKPANASGWRALYRADAARGAGQLLSAAQPLRRQLSTRNSRKSAAYGLVLARRWAARLTAGDPSKAPLRLASLDRLRARLAAAWIR